MTGTAANAFSPAVTKSSGSSFGVAFTRGSSASDNSYLRILAPK